MKFQKEAKRLTQEIENRNRTASIVGSVDSNINRFPALFAKRNSELQNNDIYDLIWQMDQSSGLSPSQLISAIVEIENYPGVIVPPEGMETTFLNFDDAEDSFKRWLLRYREYCQFNNNKPKKYLMRRDILQRLRLIDLAYQTLSMGK